MNEGIKVSIIGMVILIIAPITGLLTQNVFHIPEMLIVFSVTLIGGGLISIPFFDAIDEIKHSQKG